MDKPRSSHHFPGGQILEIVQGDITHEKVDAIVNAANSQLVHGGGVAAAIVRHGGEIIQEESDAWIKKHGPVLHPKPAFTSAGLLPCKYVIHAVGPIWGSGEEDAKLTAAIQGSLDLTEELQLKSVALPAISTGIFGFPVERAANIFMQTIESFYKANKKSCLQLVRIAIIDQPTYDIFIKTFNAYYS